MSSQLSSGNIVSNRYASALYDLADDSKVVDEVLNNLETINQCIEKNKDLKILIKSPLISSTDKFTIIEKVLSKASINKLTSNFLKVISKNKRFSSLLSIISQFININAQKRGDVSADVTSANNLSELQKNSINDQLKSVLGEKLLLNFKVDEKIIGGLIIKVGSKMIDASILSKINKLNIAMKEA